VQIPTNKALCGSELRKSKAGRMRPTAGNERPACSDGSVLVAKGCQHKVSASASRVARWGESAGRHGAVSRTQVSDRAVPVNAGRLESGKSAR